VRGYTGGKPEREEGKGEKDGRTGRKTRAEGRARKEGEIQEGAPER